jgi:3D-(3,5/4)-trihydroxycyclohexane-1,2-dione acylhydrolase (decyclizing)
LYRNEQTGIIDGDETNKNATLPVDLASNAKSLGAHVIECQTVKDIQNALIEAKSINKTTVIYTECDRHQDIEGYAWWEVPIAEVSQMKSVQKAYKEYLKHKKNQRFYY